LEGRFSVDTAYDIILCGQKFVCWSPSSEEPGPAAKNDNGLQDNIPATSTHFGPLPLTQVCRCRLRHHLLTTAKRSGLLKAVNDLPLPSALQRFLLLEELNAIY